MHHSYNCKSSTHNIIFCLTRQNFVLQDKTQDKKSFGKPHSPHYKPYYTRQKDKNKLKTFQHVVAAKRKIIYKRIHFSDSF